MLGARRAVRVAVRAAFRAFGLFGVARFRMALGGRSTMPLELADDRPFEMTGNFGIEIAG